MRRCTFFVCAVAMVSAGVLHAQDASSTWQGTVHSNSEVRRIVLQVAKVDKGGWEARSLNIEFFADPVHVDSLTVDGSKLKFTINGGKGAYEGTISADGTSIAGAWTYDGRSVPLEFQRATKETAWRLPFQYQYHFKDVTFARPSPDEPRIRFSPKLAIDHMERGALAWTGERQCVACHTNGSYMVVRPLLTEQLGRPRKELREFFISTLQKALAADRAKLRSEVEPPQVVYLAAGLAVWDAKCASSVIAGDRASSQPDVQTAAGYRGLAHRR